MKSKLMPAALVLVLIAAGCTYEGVRMRERMDCSRMPQTQAERCYARTRDTRQDYESKRRQLEASLEEQHRTEQLPVDPRFEQWLPDL